MGVLRLTGAFGLGLPVSTPRRQGCAGDTGPTSPTHSAVQGSCSTRRIQRPQGSPLSPARLPHTGAGGSDLSRRCEGKAVPVHRGPATGKGATLESSPAAGRNVDTVPSTHTSPCGPHLDLWERHCYRPTSQRRNWGRVTSRRHNKAGPEGGRARQRLGSGATWLWAAGTVRSFQETPTPTPTLALGAMEGPDLLSHASSPDLLGPFPCCSLCLGCPFPHGRRPSRATVGSCSTQRQHFPVQEPSCPPCPPPTQQGSRLWPWFLRLGWSQH